MKKSVIISIFCLFLFGCKSSNKTTSIKPEEVSLVSIIANPDKYHKKNVTVMGYFTMETEGQAIYISKSDYQAAIFKNAIYLYIGYDSLKNMDIQQPYKGYIQIEGIFNKNLKGSYGFYSGGFENITKIRRLYKRGSSTDEFNMD